MYSIKKFIYVKFCAFGNHLIKVSNSKTFSLRMNLTRYEMSVSEYFPPNYVEAVNDIDKHTHT